MNWKLPTWQFLHQVKHDKYFRVQIKLRFTIKATSNWQMNSSPATSDSQFCWIQQTLNSWRDKWTKITDKNGHFWLINIWYNFSSTRIRAAPLSCSYNYFGLHEDGNLHALLCHVWDRIGHDRCSRYSWLGSGIRDYRTVAYWRSSRSCLLSACRAPQTLWLTGKIFFHKCVFWK